MLTGKQIDEKRFRVARLGRGNLGSAAVQADPARPGDSAIRASCPAPVFPELGNAFARGNRTNPVYILFIDGSRLFTPFFFFRFYNLGRDETNGGLNMDIVFVGLIIGFAVALYLMIEGFSGLEGGL